MTTNSIKFFWNGIRVNEGSLIRCFYSQDKDGSINISARDYDDLPGDVFTVTNDTDLYTDYFDTDSATVAQDHPLYKYALYALARSEAHDIKRYIKHMDGKALYAVEVARKRAELATWEAIKNPGQPTAEDLEAIDQMNTAAETARLAAEHEEELRQREQVLRQRNEGREYINGVASEHPITDGAPVVTIQWSEHPAFYSWEENELKLSVAAAEIILKHYDEERHNLNVSEGHGGYCKTSFLISFNDPETGEPDTYEGRYDLGDNDGGMIAHIVAFAEYAKSTELLDFADWLKSFTESVKVTVAPWFLQMLEAQKKAKEQEVKNTLAMVEMLTDEQLEHAVMCVNPNDAEHADVARFFLQELAGRDKDKALDVFRRWKANA